MAEWVYFDHPDLPGGPERYPDDPDVIAAQKARGFVQVDDPDEASPAKGVEPDEVDDRGQGWVHLKHAETGGVGRFPVGVVADMRGQGWESVAVLEAAEAKKKAASKKAEPAKEKKDN